MEEVQKRENVFKNKNFVLTFFGALVSNIGATLYSFAVSFYILQITGNNAFIQGLYLAIGGIIFCLCIPFGGAIVDRLHKGKVMFICDYLKGGTIIFCTILLMLLVNDVTGKVIILFAITIINNLIAAMFTPASSSLLPHIVEKEDLQQATSYFSILSSFQSIAGVLLAGILYTLLPINLLFIIVGICYIGSGISEMFIRYEHIKPEGKINFKTVLTDIGEGFKYLGTKKAILSLILIILFINFFFSPIFDNFFPYFIATDVTGTNYILNNLIEPEMWSSIISICFGVGSLIMGFILSTREKKEHIIGGIRLGLFGTCVLITLFTIAYILFTKDILSINFILIMLLIICFIIGLLLVIINVPISTAILSIVDKDKLAKVQSIIDLSSQGLIPLSVFLAGLEITYLGSTGMLLISTIGFVLSFLFLMFNKKVNEL